MLVCFLLFCSLFLCFFFLLLVSLLVCLQCLRFDFVVVVFASLLRFSFLCLLCCFVGFAVNVVVSAK